MIIEAGVSELNPENDPRVQRIYGDEPIKVYNFFKEEFFGMERTLDKIVRYFHSAAMGGEECRQVLYLMGPVGSGKSSLVDRLIRGLEELPPIYAIDGDPMLGDPLPYQGRKGCWRQERGLYAARWQRHQGNTKFHEPTALDLYMPVCEVDI